MAAEERGRFVMAAIFRKSGDVVLDAIIVTPWPTGTVMSDRQRAITEAVGQELAHEMAPLWAEGDDGDFAIRQAWLEVPREEWTPCPKRKELTKLAKKCLTIRVNAKANGMIEKTYPVH